MIDLQHEQLVRLQRVPKLLPANERTKHPIHISAIYRWAQRGRRAVHGQCIKLETIKLGGSTLTSLEALQRFAERLSGSDPQRESRTSHVSHYRRHQIDAAAREVQRLLLNPH